MGLVKYKLTGEFVYEGILVGGVAGSEVVYGELVKNKYESQFIER